jgi:hypothetical protein
MCTPILFLILVSAASLAECCSAVSRDPSVHCSGYADHAGGGFIGLEFSVEETIDIAIWLVFHFAVFCVASFLCRPCSYEQHAVRVGQGLK